MPQIHDTIADHLAHELIARVLVSLTEKGFKVESGYTGEHLVNVGNPEVIYWDEKTGIDWQGMGKDFSHAFETFESIGWAIDGGGQYIEYHFGEILDGMKVGDSLTLRQGVIDVLSDDEYADSDAYGWYIAGDLA